MHRPESPFREPVQQAWPHLPVAAPHGLTHEAALASFDRTPTRHELAAMVAPAPAPAPQATIAVDVAESAVCMASHTFPKHP
eukprot:5392651-Prymnesium_polylepis.2